MTATSSASGRRLSAPIVILSLVAVAAASYWVYQRSIHVYTDDARISADMVLLSSKVSGLIKSMPITEGDLLQKSDLILQLDTRETRLQLEELQAQLGATTASQAESRAEAQMVERQTAGELQAAQSELEAAQANLASASADLNFKESEWHRAGSMREKNLLSQQEWEMARNAFHLAQQAQNASRAEASSAEAALVQARAGRDRLVVLEQVQQRLQYERDRVSHQLARQQVILEERQVLAPDAGIIDQTFVHAGEYLMPGQRIAIMHNPATVSVKANVKETEIRHLQLGQPVEVSVDAYPGRIFAGEVQRIGHAATSQFALLPSTNPSGNFTKVTQRLPVKIRIEQEGQLLKPGMMVEVSIDIR
jgi:membrane fusion protein (multidrug efflux system)